MSDITARQANTLQGPAGWLRGDVTLRRSGRSLNGNIAPAAPVLFLAGEAASRRGDSIHGTHTHSVPVGTVQRAGLVRTDGRVLVYKPRGGTDFASVLAAVLRLGDPKVIAAQMGVTRSSIYKWAGGLKPFPIGYLSSLLSALGRDAGATVLLALLTGSGFGAYVVSEYEQPATGERDTRHLMREIDRATLFLEDAEDEPDTDPDAVRQASGRLESLARTYRMVIESRLRKRAGSVGRVESKRRAA